MNKQTALIPFMVSVLKASVSVIKEKGNGTMEQIIVSPIQKYVYTLGNLIPFWLIGLDVFTL